MLQLNPLDCHGVFECFKFLPPFSIKYKESCIHNDKVKKSEPNEYGKFNLIDFY